MKDERPPFGKLRGQADTKRSSAQSEFAFIERIRSRTAASITDLAYGIGDDAAVIRQKNGRDSVVTADLLVEDIDFRLDYSPPNLLGHKALAVSLSDIAAMGARPRWAIISIGVPDHLWNSGFLDHFYDGLLNIADQYHVALIGGDVSRTPSGFVVDSIVLGETARGRTIPRSGAQPGDHIFVTGTLGGSATGLILLQEGHRLSNRKPRTKRDSAIDSLCRRHLQPQPRMEWGEFNGRRGLTSAMIDISDGLSSDLAHICEASGVGAIIDEASLPIDASLRAVITDPLEQLRLALNGGEDFELLFTVPARKVNHIPAQRNGVPVTRIGQITGNSGEMIIQRSDGSLQELSPGGFQHFS
jgi:thiamine-monophosphate kinase